MAISVLRAVIRRRIHSGLRQSPQRRAQSSSSSSSSPNKQPPQQKQSADTDTATSKIIASDSVPIPIPSTIPPLPIWQRLGPLTKAAQAYSRSQRKRPNITQIVSAVCIFLCADISAQSMSANEYDPKRTARSVIIGGIAAVPQYKWLVFLSTNFNYSSRILSLATKVVVSQTLFTTVFNTYFFGAQALLSGETLEATVERVRNTVPASWVNSWKVWPAYTVFSMLYIPLEYRSVFAGVIAIGWQTYLSYLNRLAELRASRDGAASLGMEDADDSVGIKVASITATP